MPQSPPENVAEIYKRFGNNKVDEEGDRAIIEVDDVAIAVGNECSRHIVDERGGVVIASL